MIPVLPFLDFTREWLSKNHPDWEVNNGLIFKSADSFQIVRVVDVVPWKRFLELHLIGEIVATVETSISPTGKYSVQIEETHHYGAIRQLCKAYTDRFPHTKIIFNHLEGTIPANY